ncbi:MAG: 50S ribosomal protein L25 [Saprospiraceae bacterium]|nr:50S ribosomal protein L25 [Saprospiraceae bacterium]
MQSISIPGELRTATGKQAAKALRRSEMVPCELYGGKENIHFSVSPKALKDLVYSPEFKVADIEIDGKTYRSIMRSIQFHPVSEQILHVDFLLLQDGRKIKVDVPVRFEGVAPGVKSGGKLTQKVHRVSLKATPEDLVDQVTLDISGLKLGQSVRVRDIVLNDKIEVLNNPGIPLASVNIPRALKSATEEAADEAAEAAEGEAAEGEEAATETPAE